jgi:hypothetical protein
MRKTRRKRRRSREDYHDDDRDDFHYEDATPSDLVYHDSD